jgi:hypothetical protein
LFYSSFKCSFEFIEDFKIKDFEWENFGF